MADTQIDELRLDITVEDKTSGESSDKKVKNLASAISHLNKNLQAFDNAKFTKVFDNMSKGLDPFVKKIEKVSNALANLATIVSKGGLDKAAKEMAGKAPELKTEPASDSDRKSEPIQVQETQTEELGTIQYGNQALDEMRNKLQDINNLSQILEIQLAQVNLAMQDSTLSADKLISLKKKQLQLEKQITLASKAQKSFIQKLGESILRIGIYRAIRAALKFILDALKAGASEISKISPSFNKTWSSALASIDKIKASLAVIGANLLPVLEPILRILADLIATIANTIGKVLAAFNGTGKAIQVNTKHQRDYNKELQKGALLSFDTFTTLQAQEKSDLYDEVDTGELGSGLAGLLDSITPIMDFINELIGILTDVLMPVIASVSDVIGGVVGQIKGAFKIIAGLLKLLTGDFEGAWNLIGDGFVDMINGVANMFIALGKFIFDALNFLFVKTNPLFWILKAAGIDVGGKIESWNANWSAKAWNPIKSYATGGAFSSADMFYANENGRTELVTSTNTGGGAVMTIDMWAQISEMSVYNALAKYGAAQNGGMAINIDMNKLGTAMASNAGFRNEANRRNVGLNWK